MNRNDLSLYKPLFLKTAREYIISLKSSLVSLSNSNTDKNAVEVIHRSAHSLGSQSLIMGYKQMGNLCRGIEHIFFNVMQGKLLLSAALIVQILDDVQLLEQSVTQIEKTNQEQDFSGRVEKLEKVVGHSIQ